MFEKPVFKIIVCVIFLFAGIIDGTANDYPGDLLHPGVGQLTINQIGLSVVDFEEMQAIKNRIEQKDKEVLIWYNKLIENANDELSKEPYSVTNKTGVPPSGSKHDYMTIAPYFWPNPDTPDGLPYIRKDGEVNPEARNNFTDFKEKDRFFGAVDVLGKAFYYTGEKIYAGKAISLIRAWFLDPATAMNPNLNFGQGIPGEIEGRPFGIIEFGGIRSVLAALELLKWGDALDADTDKGVNSWLIDYLHWLQTSNLGKKEATRSNNHGTTYDVQLCNILLYLGETEQIRNHLEKTTKSRIRSHIEPDGRQPHELARTKSFSYSVTNLSAFTKLAAMGKKVGVDLWNYASDDGRGLKKAYEFLINFVVSDKEWEYQQITSLEEQKSRFVNLLEYAGKEFGEDNYLEIASNYTRKTTESKAGSD
jgi:hypothetical protein